MNSENKRRKIILRMQEHLDAAINADLDWVGVFLQGSQNYGLDYAGSDVDTKIIVLPSFDDIVLNRKPVSCTHEMENGEHADFKDIRLMFDCFRKQNTNFLEILFTDYFILNPKYAELFSPVIEHREDIARYNNYASINGLVGMAMQKQKAMEHPYPSLVEKIKKYGYDPKQLSHALRLSEFMARWIDGEPYKDCLQTNCPEYLLGVKLGMIDLKTARIMMMSAIESMKEVKAKYLAENAQVINSAVDEILKTVTVNILKSKFADDLRKEAS